MRLTFSLKNYSLCNYCFSITYTIRKHSIHISQNDIALLHRILDYQLGPQMTAVP